MKFLFEYEPAWPFNIPGLDQAEIRERAMEINTALSSEPRHVQLVARWRRHHPTEDWNQLWQWLSGREIAEAIRPLWDLASCNSVEATGSPAEGVYGQPRQKVEGASCPPGRRGRLFLLPACALSAAGVFLRVAPPARP